MMMTTMTMTRRHDDDTMTMTMMQEKQEGQNKPYTDDSNKNHNLKPGSLHFFCTTMFLSVIITLLILSLWEIEGFLPLGHRMHGRAAKRMSMNCSLRDISLNVEDLSKAVEFYRHILQPFQSVDAEPASSSFRFTFNKQGILTLNAASTRKKIEKGNGFEGFTFGRPDSEALMHMVSTSDNVERKHQVYQFGASIIPDEDELKLFDVEYGRVLDPMSHKINIQKCPNTFDRIVLNVVDLDESIEFYQKNLGLSLLRKRSNVNNRPKEASFSAYMGNEEDRDSPSLELLYHYSTEHIKLGDTFGEIVFQAEDFSRTAETIRENAISFAQDKDQSITVADPNGYKIRIVSK